MVGPRSACIGSYFFRSQPANILALSLHLLERRATTFAQFEESLSLGCPFRCLVVIMPKLPLPAGADNGPAERHGLDSRDQARRPWSAP
jgi:hypothetical protein